MKLLLAVLLLFTISTTAFAQDAGVPSGVDPNLPVPSTARQQVPGRYLVDGTPASAVLAFYQQALPTSGWAIDSSSSDPTGTNPVSGGVRSLVVCRNGAWDSITFGDQDGGTLLLISVNVNFGDCP